jgi:tRNA pseudouridine38-40 synthase
MPKIKLTLEYDGTRYVGWQIQPNGPSIQQELENALRQLLQTDCDVVGAGRTDAGVHARGQVAHIVVPKQVESRKMMRGLNALLADDIRVLDAEEVGPDFHARYSAKLRIYSYQLALRPTALERYYSWFVGGYEIDRKHLDTCAAAIVGEHDFTSFCRTESSPLHHLCRVTSARWIDSDARLCFEISANRFVHGMVRSLVGTMVEIARGHRAVEEFVAILAVRDRRAAGMAAPAKGLFLERVVY